MNKRELTKLFLEQAGLDSSGQTVKEYLLKWWVAPFSATGLRLTFDGAEFLHKQLKLDRYKFTVKEDCPKNLKIMIQMNKYLTSPFYLNNSTITVYGETDAVMIGIMGGDLASYLENFTRE